MGLFSIVLHYAFTYIGLSTTDNSKNALIYVCFAFLFFKNEKFCVLKIVGAFIGFGGIIVINYNPDGISFCLHFGALILGENIFEWQYLLAFLLISFGIVLGNKSDKI